MQKRVVFFIPTLEYGGAEKNMVNILSGINVKKYDIALLVCKKRGQFLKDIPEFIPVFELGSVNSMIVFFKMIIFFKRQKPNLFVSNLSRFNAINLLARIMSRSKSKIIVVEHTPVSLLPLTAKTFFHRAISYFIFPGLVNILYKTADGVIAVSSGAQKDLQKILGGKGRIEIVYNPVVSKSMLEAAKEDITHVWFKNKNIPVVLSVGRLVSAKNHPLLLEAIKLVLEKKEVNLVILGQGQEREMLEKLALKLGIKQHIDFIGFQENPFKYMARADVFVSSSLREGFGNAIVEAMALGLPVVSTDCSGPVEIIGDAGVLVSAQNPQAMAAAVLKVLNDNAFKDVIVRKGLVRASDFSVSASVANYEKVFDEVLI